MGTDVQITTILVLVVTILLSVVAGVFSGFRFFDVIVGTIVGCIAFIFEILFAKDNALIFFTILLPFAVLGYFVTPFLRKVLRIEKSSVPISTAGNNQGDIGRLQKPQKADGNTEPYVSYCDGVVKLKNISQELEKVISLPIRKTSDTEIEIPYSDEDQLVSIFDRLRNLGISFSAGKEWSPAEQFEYLRKKGKLTGDFKKIYWLGLNIAEIVVL